MNARMMYTACPLCAAVGIEDLRTADCTAHPLYKPALPPAITWRRCLACGHVFTNGYFTDDARNLMMTGTNEGQKLGADLERQRFISARMVDKVLQYVTSGDWLDVGFGNGALLFTAQEYGFTPIGIDLRAENVDLLKAVGVQAHCADLSSLKLERKCQVISMADVLEHLPFPKITLRAAARLLAPDGVLFISMPNADSMLWRLLDVTNANPYWAELEHYHNFGRRRLFALLVEMGFTPKVYGVSERYRAGMEVIAQLTTPTTAG